MLKGCKVGTEDVDSGCRGKTPLSPRCEWLVSKLWSHVIGGTCILEARGIAWYPLGIAYAVLLPQLWKTASENAHGNGLLACGVTERKSMLLIS